MKAGAASLNGDTIFRIDDDGAIEMRAALFDSEDDL